MSQPPSPTTIPSHGASSAISREPLTLSQTEPQESNAAGVRVPRPSISFAGTEGGRRPSVQFDPGLSIEADRRIAKPNAPNPKLQRRMSSPPPPSNYESRVSFNTFDNPDATDISFTLVCKHKDYEHTRQSRTFLCGTDQNDYSEFALDWLIEELAEDGDEIVCLRVVSPESKMASDPNVQQGIYKEEASSLLASIQKKNEGGKAISLVLELAVGKVSEVIQRMIHIYAPTSLIVGTRGRSLGGISGLLPGSVSKWCLQNSPVPVVVVRPDDQRDKKKAKRLADPTRQGYSDIVTNVNPVDDDRAIGGVLIPLSDEDVREPRAVTAEAGVGERQRAAGETERKESTLDEVAATGFSEVRNEDSPSPTGPLVMDDEGLDEVPALEALGSPVLAADNENSERDEDVPKIEDLD